MIIAQAYALFNNQIIRDGIVICIGKGNIQWLNPTPHGAGRIMSRAQTKKQISMSKFENAMTGIYSSSICQGSLDESPMAYKPTEKILEFIRLTVEVVRHDKAKTQHKRQRRILRLQTDI